MVQTGIVLQLVPTHADSLETCARPKTAHFALGRAGEATRTRQHSWPRDTGRTHTTCTSSVPGQDARENQFRSADGSSQHIHAWRLLQYISQTPHTHNNNQTPRQTHTEIIPHTHDVSLRRHVGPHSTRCRTGSLVVQLLIMCKPRGGHPPTCVCAYLTKPMVRPPEPIKETLSSFMPVKSTASTPKPAKPTATHRADQAMMDSATGTSSR